MALKIKSISGIEDIVVSFADSANNVPATGIVGLETSGNIEQVVQDDKLILIGKGNSQEYVGAGIINVNGNTISADMDNYYTVDEINDLFDATSSYLDKTKQDTLIFGYNSSDAISSINGNPLISSNEKDWTDEINVASAYAYEQAIAQIPAPFDPTFLSGAIDKKMDKTFSSNFYPMNENPNGYLTEHQDLSDYATKTYVNKEVGKVGSYVTATLVNNEPDVQNPSNKKIYLTKDNTITGTDLYKEWIYTESSAWDCIGDTSMDLSNYYTKSETSGKEELSDEFDSVYNNIAKEYDPNKAFYPVGSLVMHDNQLYQAKYNTQSGEFNPIYWNATNVANKTVTRLTIYPDAGSNAYPPDEDMINAIQSRSLIVLSEEVPGSMVDHGRPQNIFVLYNGYISNDGRLNAKFVSNKLPNDYHQVSSYYPTPDDLQYVYGPEIYEYSIDLNSNTPGVWTKSSVNMYLTDSEDKSIVSLFGYSISASQTGDYVEHSELTCKIGTNNTATKSGTFVQGTNNNILSNCQDTLVQGEGNIAGYRCFAQGENNKAGEGGQYAEHDALAQGYSNTAGNYSLAQGNHCSATNTAFAQGDSCSADNYSFAQGNHNIAIVGAIFAQGSYVTANNFGVSFGNKTSSYNYSFVEGSNASATNWSLGLGQNISAFTGSFAQGQTISAITYSLAQGSNVKASNYSIAQGQYCTAYMYSFAQGGWNCSAYNQSFAQGKDCSAKDQSLAQGENCTSLSYSFAQGKNCSAQNYSFAQGKENLAQNYSFAQGENVKATGQHSHAEGYQTTAEGDESHAEGNSTTARGDNSHAEGWETIAVGARSHTEGCGTSAYDYDAHAEGSDTIASGIATHAEGSNTVAKVYYAHAEGDSTSALSKGSHAEGWLTIADDMYMHAQGRCNKTSAHIAFVIGNGTVDNNDVIHRSDAFIVDWNGVASAVNLKTSAGQVMTEPTLTAGKQYSYTTTGWHEFTLPEVPTISAQNGITATTGTGANAGKIIVGIDTTNYKLLTTAEYNDLVTISGIIAANSGRWVLTPAS